MGTLLHPTPQNPNEIHEVHTHKGLNSRHTRKRGMWGSSRQLVGSQASKGPGVEIWRTPRRAQFACGCTCGKHV